MNIDLILNEQKTFFAQGFTRPVANRVLYLGKLKKYLADNEKLIANAVKKDLGRHPFETYMAETGLAVTEINYMLRHIGSLAKDKSVPTPLMHFPARSFVKAEPYGSVLIAAPWNYPVMLSVIPLIDAVAAGNTAVLKMSSRAPESAKAVADMISAVFPPEYVTVLTCGRDEAGELFSADFDYIFFTGSKQTGKLVAAKAAEKLIPVTLELGGKNPVIVDKTANLRIAARRIVFGKFLNCGQTCVAPDYVLCDESVKDELIENIKAEIVRQYDENCFTSLTYAKIVDGDRFDRITALMDESKIVFGGRAEKCILKIEPTVMDNVTWDDRIMQEEIFGPVLPVLSFRDLSEAVRAVNSREKPLALYVFSSDKANVNYLLESVPAGGGCVNDTLVHMITPYSPFGGAGESGMGCYHGKYGFETFTRKKAILSKSMLVDLRPRYQPYTLANELLTKLIMSL